MFPGKVFTWKLCNSGRSCHIFGLNFDLGGWKRLPCFGILHRTLLFFAKSDPVGYLSLFSITGGRSWCLSFSIFFHWYSFVCWYFELLTQVPGSWKTSINILAEVFRHLWRFRYKWVPDSRNPTWPCPSVSCGEERLGPIWSIVIYFSGGNQQSQFRDCS